MQACGPQTAVAQNLGAASGERLVHAAGEIPLFQSNIAEHRLRDRHVLRLPAVRSTRERELIVLPFQRGVSARVEERNELEWFRARAPRGDQGCVARRRDDVVAHNRGVHSVIRLDDGAARDDDV